MINCDFLIFRNCNHSIKELTTFSPVWFCSLNSIHALKKKWSFISIESNIGVRYLKPVYIIGWWTDTYSFMNGNICVLKFITDVQNPGSESMYSRDSNVYYEGVF